MDSKLKHGLLTGAATVAAATIGMVSSAVAAPPEWCSKIAGGIYCAQPERKSPILRDEKNQCGAGRWFCRQRLASADDGRRHQRSKPLPECDQLDAYGWPGQYPEVNFRH